MELIISENKISRIDYNKNKIQRHSYKLEQTIDTKSLIFSPSIPVDTDGNPVVGP